MTQVTESVVFSLSLEFGPALSSLLATFVVGVIVYLTWDPLHTRFEAAAQRVGRIGMAAQFERTLHGIPLIASASTRLLQTGSLPSYVGLAAATITLLMILAFAATWDDLAWPTIEGLPSLGVLGACAVIVVGAMVALFQRDRLVLLLTAGLVGYGSGLLFLFTGAPDVAYTQFTVETVFVIVVASVLLALRRKGRVDSLAEPLWRPAAFLLAAAFGAVITALLLVATAGDFNTALSEYFAKTSVPEAYGRNVVNVILVDFRALDTLGEITVVMLSFLAALPLLGAWRVRQTTAKDDS